MNFYLAVVQFTLLIIFTAAAPQRSPYAPGPVVYPEVLPQYTTPSGGDVDSRFGSGSTTQTAFVYVPTDPGSLLPIDNLNWIQQNWPQDKKPFNVLNSEHLLNHRGGASQSTVNNGAASGANNNQQQPASTNLRGSFAGGPIRNPPFTGNTGFRSGQVVERRPNSFPY